MLTNRFTRITIFYPEHEFFLSQSRLLSNLDSLKLFISFFFFFFLGARFYKDSPCFTGSVKILWWIVWIACAIWFAGIKDTKKLTFPRQSRSAGVTVYDTATRVPAPLSSFLSMKSCSSNAVMHWSMDAFYSRNFEPELHHVPKKHHIVNTRVKREKHIVPRSSRWATSSATEHQI